MVIVRFNHWNEFREELNAKPPEDRVVRLTFSLRYDGHGDAHLTMVVGYLDQGNIVEFVHYLGLEPRDKKSQRAVELEKLFDERKAELERLGFTVKSGRYHVPPNVQR